MVRDSNDERGFTDKPMKVIRQGSFHSTMNMHDVRQTHTAGNADARQGQRRVAMNVYQVGSLLRDGTPHTGEHLSQFSGLMASLATINEVDRVNPRPGNHAIIRPLSSLAGCQHRRLNPMVAF
jgi:hypothetical protein